MESNPRIFIRRLALYALVCVAAAVIISVFIIGLNRFFIIGALTGCLLIIYKSVYWWNLPAKLTETVVLSETIPPSEESSPDTVVDVDIDVNASINANAQLVTATQKRPLRALLLNVFIQLMTGTALLVAVLVNVTFFYGMATGMLAAIAGTVAGTLRSKQWRV